ncbi:DUF2690 domain-containing protein [Streptomyces sp. S3(2020)]|uniref:DUF2690 domain-containing protein n=1 Tax=Streptomyces sp. S3(2020) TaxID=2732044 RepID=UPI001488BC08|nr:DUF2690 domain-containing protein [Streptomyces sp. S3(2020)]NNN36876.1 DUF2690 domain-containing protein [Streptomyces sp. S3(2020)]
MRNRTTWARTAAAILLAGGGLLAATPAHAASACSGSACDGKDPSVYCQGDARTEESVRLGQALLELRYSPSCRAAWGRISNAGYDTRDQFTPYATVHRNSDGREYSCSVSTDGTSCYTRMVNDANVTSYAKGMWDSGARTYEDRTASY